MNAGQSSSPLDAPAAQAAFAAAMREPAAYSALHPVAGPVTCIETHVSWVFLTGPFAYKVKKPLRLSFIDYSTAERRAVLCREELRLNRRHAPGLYVDVVPIAGTPAAPRVGATDAPPFEHALRMVQFDPRLELTQLLQTGTIAAGELQEFGQRVAQMHATAAIAASTESFGAPDHAHRITLDNFAEIARVLPGRDEARQLEILRGHAQRLLEASRSLMEQRRQGGRIREGHGDLHCGNVVRWQGTLAAFDGLEFDPALRFIDVANDLAFLTMDLAVHRRADLRREALQAWLEASGDFEAVALLPYFELYRALVRAKVAALRGQQARGEAAGAATLAHQYLDWAVAQLERPRPRLVVMAGLSGSGKTWLARRIAASCNALIVRSDIERKRLAGLQPLDTSASAPDAGIYSREFNERTYERLRDCAGHCLQGHESVIVDAANLRRGERGLFVAAAREHAAGVTIVQCVAPLAVLRQRVAARAGADASEATVSLLDRQPAYWEPFDGDERSRVVVVDTTSTGSIERALDGLARPTYAGT
ncbi:MAG: AAA family ATPase [Gammaproteobacteria bacterium]|nr:AAA family ATPase [Gammaproteobacteria bacterium]MDH5272242.1 AAA family ATPase [Gammaproteobacteria bacterium]